jgi:hypothetical protein
VHAGTTTQASLQDAQSVRRKAGQAGYTDAYLNLFQNSPAPCKPEA